MSDRSLEALGLHDVPALRPLTYPGRPVREPVLLSGRELLPLGVTGARVGEWAVASTADPQGRALDQVLEDLGDAPTRERYPVIAVGSNASPAQVSYKLQRAGGLSRAVPMVPVEIHGIGVGLSAHISRAGYVSASPYVTDTRPVTLVVSWLDEAQLAAVDATEFPNYGRALLPGDGDGFPMVLPNGWRLEGAYLYFNTRGLLAHPDGTPRPTAPQPDVLRALLRESAPLRDLLGPDPESWVARAAADPRRCAAGTAVFEEEGWLLQETRFSGYAVAG
ncbi:hypothetical protein ACWGJ2_29930 [Streptomyces sp. NPDC054796]